tara:strand:+ start:1730 stop:3304 length:1575 start_codon:yes stop_codon:yes gene_type:complete
MIKSDPFFFDDDAANRACEFFQQLVHVKGPLAGQPFELEKWQEEDIIRPLFGWKRQDGTRKYRTAYIEIPRKNGKSTLCAAIALYLTFCDHPVELGAEVYSVAGDRDQASLVFDPACEMIRRCPMLNERATIRSSVKRVVFKETGSYYRAIAADVGGSHGYNASGVLFDELHVQKTRDLWDVMLTSTGARLQPMVLGVTTAGHDKSSICYELHQYSKGILEGRIDDPTFLPVIYAADPEDDWTDPSVWAKANPNLGVSISEDYLRDQCLKARESAAYENTFRRLHLNQWTEQSVRVIPMEAWRDCPGDADEEMLEGERCFAGLDLASTRDVTALTLVFPQDEGRFAVLPYFFVPEEVRTDRDRQDRRQTLNFAAAGLIEKTPGDEVDGTYIRERILQLAETFDIEEIAFDPWNATHFIQSLVDAGLPHDAMVKFPQTFGNYNEPMKKLIQLVDYRKLDHGGNKVLEWMAGNTAARTDPSGNMRPDKSKSADKIDGIVALLMGLARAIRSSDSAYDDRAEFITIG